MNVDRQDYTELPIFDGLRLEDSWVRRIKVSGSIIEFSLDFVLREKHPLFSPPLRGEALCYRSGTLSFSDFSGMEFDTRGGEAAGDPEGLLEVGFIDSMWLSGDSYLIVGEWGTLRMTGAKVSLALSVAATRKSGLSPADIVQEFADLTASCLDLMRLDQNGAAHVITRPVGRVGRLGTVGWFRFHGRGCCFELDSGEVLDVDWDETGRAIFDVWRIQNFARSVGIETAHNGSLLMAAKANSLLHHVEGDWFTWADSGHDLQRGASMTKHHDRDKRSAVHTAAFSNDLDALTALVASGANLDATDRAGFTPLHLATQQGNLESALLLLNSGCSVDPTNVYGNTPLFTAVFNSDGGGALITLLREHGADPHQRNHAGVSPVALARLIANVDVRQHFADLA